MPKCLYCGKKVSILKATTDLYGHYFCNKECRTNYKQGKRTENSGKTIKEDFKETKKEFKEQEEIKTKKEKELEILNIVGFFASIVFAYFFYNKFLIPWGDLFGFSKTWRIGFAIFSFFVFLGMFTAGMNIFKSHQYTAQKLAKEDREKPKESALEILKKRYAEGKITHKEFVKRKKTLKE